MKDPRYDCDWKSQIETIRQLDCSWQGRVKLSSKNASGNGVMVIVVGDTEEDVVSKLRNCLTSYIDETRW